MTRRAPAGENSTDPQPGDIYKASPTTSVDKDKHGRRPRPVAVVERLPRVAMCLGRSTHPDQDARTMASPRNPEVGLTEDGWWQDRHQRPVARRFWGTPDFTYSGTLPVEERDALIAFWQQTTLLGRKGL